MSSYDAALEAAGAVIHDSESFGSWQGDALYEVTYKGVTGFIVISYGSCSGCDSFQASFGYLDNEACPDHMYANERDVARCVLCSATKASYQARLADFGRSYLEDGQVQPASVLRAKYEADLEWDYDAAAIIGWLDKHEGAS